ncbi:hypothetical protein MNBD_DELTA01-1964 [hydrothermal vent metagenome]|uniref:Uncharacterized protein n=1 Tax=hydrothermal vent metagenome TaxID=652676 RepID=A0A3B0RCQ1_9ZZZZ
MKKLIILLIAACFLLASTAAFAEYERIGIGGGGDKDYKKHNKSEYAKPVLIKAIGFKAKLKDGKVYTSWKRYTRADFKYYKVVKSRTNRNPVYPEDGAVFYSGDSTETRFKDHEVEPGVWYYRLCIITKQNRRWVSSVVMIRTNTQSRSHSTPPTYKDFQ